VLSAVGCRVFPGDLEASRWRIIPWSLSMPFQDWFDEREVVIRLEPFGHGLSIMYLLGQLNPVPFHVQYQEDKNAGRARC